MITRFHSTNSDYLSLRDKEEELIDLLSAGDEIIEIDTGCACDGWASNHGFNPDGLSVQQATVNFLLAQM